MEIDEIVSQSTGAANPLLNLSIYLEAKIGKSGAPGAALPTPVWPQETLPQHRRGPGTAHTEKVRGLLWQPRWTEKGEQLETPICGEHFPLAA